MYATRHVLALDELESTAAEAKSSALPSTLPVPL